MFYGASAESAGSLSVQTFRSFMNRKRFHLRLLEDSVVVFMYLDKLIENTLNWHLNANMSMKQKLD